MSITTEDWLDGAACHSVPPEEAEKQPVRLRELPRSQKRELAGFGLAAITSCAFFLSPLMLADARDRELPATALAIRFAPTPLVVPTTVPAQRVRPRASTSAAARKTILRSRTISNDLTPVASRALSTSIAGAPAQLAQVALVARDDERRTRVSRLLLGDGRHRVKPFPTPTTEQN